MEPGAPHAELKRAYRKLALEWHPDRNRSEGAADRFKEIASAWQVVGDPEQRRRFDLKQGRASRGELPEEFLMAVADAIDRSEYWIRSVVLPHYARHWRGLGAEMAAQLLVDLETLTTPASLEPASWWKRRKVSAITDSIVVTVLMQPSHQASVIVRGVGFVEIALLPFALWRAGIREPAELDDAVLRLLLARYSQVFASGRLLVRGTPEPDALTAQARAIDSSFVARRTARFVGWSVMAAILGLMLASGYNQW